MNKRQKKKQRKKQIKTATENMQAAVHRLGVACQRMRKSFDEAAKRFNKLFGGFNEGNTKL